jgi:hypothetical protein
MVVLCFKIEEHANRKKKSRHCQSRGKRRGVLVVGILSF